jgi:hypothetical protein
VGTAIEKEYDCTHAQERRGDSSMGPRHNGDEQRAVGVATRECRNGEGRKRAAEEVQEASKLTAAAQRMEAMRRRIRAKSIVTAPCVGQCAEEEIGAASRANDVDHRGRTEFGDIHFARAACRRDRDETVGAVAAYNSGASAREGPGDALVEGDTGIAVDPFGGRAAVPVAQTSDAAALPQCTEEDARLARISRGKAACSPPRGAAAPLDDSDMTVTDSLGTCSTSPQTKPQSRSGEGPLDGQIIAFPLTKPEAEDLERDQAMGSATLQTTGDPPLRGTVRRRVGAGVTRVGYSAARGSGAAAGADDGMQPQRGCLRHHHVDARRRECPVNIPEDVEMQEEVHHGADYSGRDVVGSSPSADTTAAGSDQCHSSSHRAAAERPRRRGRELDDWDNDGAGDRGVDGGRPDRESHRLDHPVEGAGGQRLRDLHGAGGLHWGSGRVPLGRGAARDVQGSPGGPHGPLRRPRPPPDLARRRLCEFLSGRSSQASGGAGNAGDEHRQGPVSDSNGGESTADSAGHVRGSSEQRYREHSDRGSDQRGPPVDKAGRGYANRQDLLAQLRSGPSIWPKAAAGAMVEESGEDRGWRDHKRPRLASRDGMAGGMPLTVTRLRSFGVDAPAAWGCGYSSSIGREIRGRVPPGATPAATTRRVGDIAARTSDCPPYIGQAGSSAAAAHAAARVAWHIVDASSDGTGLEHAS